MKVLEDPAVSAATSEFLIEFVQFGTLTRPATRRNALVRASTAADAKKILRMKYPRTDQYVVKRQQEMTLDHG